MQSKRKFRRDIVFQEKEYKFNRGDIATIVKEEKPNIAFKINKKSYMLPYRDFIVVTEIINPV